MNRFVTVSSMLAALTAGIGLYLVKYQVSARAAEVAALERQIARDRKAIAVLEAEWAHLASPERVERMARAFTQLKPVPPARVIMLQAAHDQKEGAQ